MSSITNNMRECVAQVRKGGFCAYSIETFLRCASAGLLTWRDGEPSDEAASYELTTAGHTEADVFELSKKIKRTAANARARANNQGARDAGLVRSRFGGWE